MDELADEMAQTALELIDEFGADIQYIAIGTESYDPAQSRNIVTPADPKPAKALIEDFKLGETFVSGGLIRSGDKKLTIAGAALEDGIAAGGKVRLGSDIYNVMNVKTTYLASTPVLFEVQGRA